MAIEQKRTCDVFPAREAQPYLLTLQAPPRPLPTPDGPNRQWEADLSERAVQRLVKFIERGLSKPKGKVIR
jgi:hypothetical protein